MKAASRRTTAPPTLPATLGAEPGATVAMGEPVGTTLKTPALLPLAQTVVETAGRVIILGATVVALDGHGEAISVETLSGLCQSSLHKE